MTNRERALAVLRYQKYDRLPLVHFGWWTETIEKWTAEGHLTKDEAKQCGDGNDPDIAAKKLGFDFNWQNMFYSNSDPMPKFEREVLKEFPDGSRHVRDRLGAVVVENPNASGIPAEIDHLLKDRASWETHYKKRMEWKDERVDKKALDQLKGKERKDPLGLHCGSLYGDIRDMMGVEGISYLYADDECLYREIIDTMGELCYRKVKTVLESGVKFDFAHFWEDICFKNGPLVVPTIFEEYVGPHYKRITDMVRASGIDIISLDCDGWIDALIPIWLDNGVNTMFPIEVGTWNASIAPWRKKYGKKILGVGGMNKTVFAHDKAAIDAEVERLKPLVELGGYIPCPDHRIPPDAKWDMVQYYCEKMHKVFG